jgi:hypothetical protein
MVVNKKDVIGRHVLFVYKLYECFFMPRLEAIGGASI